MVDKESNANGGMLVSATSMPDEREWIQWKGRTARQDRPGQFYIALDDTRISRQESTPHPTPHTGSRPPTASDGKFVRRPGFLGARWY